MINRELLLSYGKFILFKKNLGGVLKVLFGSNGFECAATI